MLRTFAPATSSLRIIRCKAPSCYGRMLPPPAPLICTSSKARLNSRGITWIFKPIYAHCAKIKFAKEAPFCKCATILLWKRLWRANKLILDCSGPHAQLLHSAPHCIRHSRHPPPLPLLSRIRTFLFRSPLGKLARDFLLLSARALVCPKELDSRSRARRQEVEWGFVSALESTFLHASSYPGKK